MPTWSGELFRNVDVSASLQKALPAQLAPLAGPAAAGLQQLAGQAAPRVLASPQAQAAWVAANVAAHKQLLKVLNGGGAVVSTQSGVVTLNLHALVSELAATLGVSDQLAAARSKLQGSTGASARGAAQQKLGITLPPANGQLVILRANQLSTAQDVANGVKGLAIVLPGLAIVLFALAVYLARGRRRRTLRTCGWCFVLIGVALLLIRRVAGDAVVDGLVKVASNKPAVHDVWNIATSLLYDLAIAMIVYGLVIVAAAWLGGRTRPATAIRKALAPSLRDSPAVAYLAVGGVLALAGAVGSDPGIAEYLVDPAVRRAARARSHDAATRDRDRVPRHRAQRSRAQLHSQASSSRRARQGHAGGARRVARAPGSASRPRRDHRRRVPDREGTRHQQRHLRPGDRISMAHANPPRPDLIERRMSRFLRQPVSVRNAASVIVGATLAIVVAGGVAIRILDHHEYSNIWLGMWWALQTVTTVGYGDITPKNTSGRLVGVLMMLQGIAFLTIATAAITSTFVARAEAQRGAKKAAEEQRADDRLNLQLDDLSVRLDRVERLLTKLTER